MAAPFDTLKLAQVLRHRALRDRAGFSQEHAEAAADALAEAVSEQVATKQDVASVCTDINALRVEMRLASGRTELGAIFDCFERRMTMRLGGMLTAWMAIMLALKFLVFSPQ